MPHLRSRHAYFPTIVEAENGDLVVAMDIGTAFEAIDVRSYVCRSSDSGKSWTEPMQLFEPNQSSHPVSTSCRMGKLDDGTLLGWAGLFNRTREHEGLANPSTEGFCSVDYATIQSLDGGNSWSELRSVELPHAWDCFEVCAPPFQVSENRLLVVTHPFLDWNGWPSPWGRNGLALESTDNGSTWANIKPTFSDPNAELAFYESALTRLSDGRILAMCWTMDANQGKSLNNHLAISSDDGRNFEIQQSTLLKGETCRPIGIENNHVLVVYRRVDKQGLWARLASVGDPNLKSIDEKLLWGGNVESHRTDLDSHLAQLSTLKFGCPAVVKLQDGDIFIVFWAVEDCCSVIRWFRISID
ncbi:sialidase family protein [Adhaeretor mobilis]|nr:sialidase family protein [Adhaeretor mobilis]